ncbi:MAG TPA: hypothetical protein VKE51_10000 [Vicinamibacterales bacterium]|nr:hypothetical protein [Vicinamibacterales bacterium]
MNQPRWSQLEARCFTLRSIAATAMSLCGPAVARPVRAAFVDCGLLS